MTEPVIVTQGLTRHFGDTVAVDNLTLEVYAGEIFGFLGHNGAGKTTTVRLLNGVLTPTAGQAHVLGLVPATDGPALRQHTGVLTETPSLDERLTGRDNLTIFADLFNVPEEQVATRVEELLHLFDLAERADERVGNYSKGMKQRLALARTLLHAPQCLFLDEPTAGLDPVATRQVHNLVRRLSRQEERTVFLCTHNLNEAQQLCDRVGVMENGQLIAVGTPAELSHRITSSLALELEVAPAGRETALRVLDSFAGVTAAPSENGTLRVSGAGRELVPDLLAGLIQAGVRIYRATPQEPSLEDAYFALHEQHLSRNSVAHNSVAHESPVTPPAVKEEK